MNGPSSPWRPPMGPESTNLHYWLNWRVLLCAIWVLSSMIAASILIWKYEGPDSGKEEAGTERPETFGTLYDDESWRTCLKAVHPAWLLLFRVLAFFVLLSLLVANFVVEGGDIFYYYTQWTSVLVTIYFGLGSLLSVYGNHKYLNNLDGDKFHQTKLDAECGPYVAPKTEENANKSDPYTSATSEENVNEHGTFRKSGFHEELNVQEIAGFWGYVFQIIYQANAGAVMLTDCVFWLIIFPFRAIKDYDLDLLLIGMHSVNAVFLLGDTALNCSRFPWFRISYFFLWTSGYVIFQWVIHTCVSWWPYPFLDLSDPHAPLWYFLAALFHIPCYAVFPLIIKLKHYLLSRRFPQSYSCRR